jgi:sugar lactone lactonase YvrE
LFLTTPPTALFANTTTSQNLGAVAVGASTTATLTFSFSTSTTLGSVKVVTQGTAGLDFQTSSTSPGTCATGTTYGAGQTCTVNLVFVPKGIGQRLGAVLLYDDASTPDLIATTYLAGTGNGGLLSFMTTQQTLGSGLSYPYGIAVDGEGNAYLADGGNNRVVKVPANGGAQASIGTGLVSPMAVAVDGAGNLYIADIDNNRVVEVSADSGTQTAFASALSSPSGVAVDGVGNVYIAEYANGKVVEMPAGGGAPTTVASDLYHPYGLAVDGSGNVYIADYDNNRVVKVSAGGKETTIGSGFHGPLSVAVDGSNNVYVTDNGNSRVVEVSADGSTQTTIENRYGVTGIAVDGAGNLYVTGVSQGLIESVRTQLPATVNLGTATVGSIPTTAQVSFTNIGNVPLAFRANINSSRFTESDICNGSVAINSSCTFNLTFTPTSGLPAPGMVTAGTLTLTDNSLNPTQAIGLTGTAIVLTAAQPLISPASGTYTGTQMVSITDATPNATIYYTTDGTTPSRSSPIYSTPITVSASETIKALAVAPNYFTSAEGVAAYTIKAPVGNTITSKNFGAIAVGSSTTTAVTLSFGGTATLGSIKVVTQGTTGLDFQQATSSPGTCKAGLTYAAAQACTVNVIFAPKGIGQRLGAVLFYDNASTPNLIGTGLLQGTGNAGLLQCSTGESTVGTGLSSPYGVTADAAGNVYIADAGHGRVVEAPANGGIQTTLVSGLAFPYGLVLDGAGNLYIADYGKDHIIEIQAGTGAQLSVGSGLLNPMSVAVDAQSNVYVADLGTYVGHSGQDRIVEFPAGTSTAMTIGSGYLYPHGLAVDGAGNVYIADSGNGRVIRVSAASGLQTVVASGLGYPLGVAVDGAGNTYVADFGDGLVEIPVGSSTHALLSNGLNTPYSVAVDGTGNVFAGDSANNHIAKFDRTQLPATVNFGTATVGGSSATAQVSFTNIGNVPLAFRVNINSSRFTESDTCTGSVAVNSSCMLNLRFTPTSGLPAPGMTTAATLTLTDNSLTPTQPIGLTGTAIVLTAAQPIISPASGTYTGTQMVSITDVTPNTTIYYTTDGTTPSRSSAIYSGLITVSSSETIKALAVAPNYFTSAEGVAIYAIKH